MTRTTRRRIATYLALGLALIATLGLGACHRGCHGGGHAWHDGDGEVDEDRLRRGVAWVLREADPTDAQVDEITAIAKAGLDDLHGLKAGHAEAHEALSAALAADPVDREALERLRADALATLDEGSRTAAVVMADVAEVLTPEQRALLIEAHEEHGRFGRRWY